MSVGTKLPWAEAYDLAKNVAAELEGAVARSKCVGSLRRKRREVGDIEFVVEPHYQEDLVGDRYPIIDSIQVVLEEVGTWVKGKHRMMQVSDLFGVEGVQLDLYIVLEPAQWGSIVAIRTGPAELGKHVMWKMRDFGFRHRQGHAERIETGEIVPTPEEEDFFALANVPCVAPAKRDALLQSLQRRS